MMCTVNSEQGYLKAHPERGEKEREEEPGRVIRRSSETPDIPSCPFPIRL